MSDKLPECVSCQMSIIGKPRAVGHASDGVTHATDRECVMAVRRELSALRAALDQQANDHQSHVEELESSIHIANREREEAQAALDQEREKVERVEKVRDYWCNEAQSALSHAADLTLALEYLRPEVKALRAFAQWALDRIPDAVCDEMHKHGLIDINGEPTALLSGRGEGR